MDIQKTSLVVCLLAAFCLATCGLEFHLDKTFVCGQLVCEANADQTDPSVFTVIQLSVIDTTNTSPKVKLASISVLEPEVHVDDGFKNNINVEGNISDYHAHLQIDFKNQSYCTSGSFMCQLTYVNPAGHLDVMQSPEIHGGSSSTSNVTCGVSSDVMNVIGQLSNSIDNLELGETTVEETVKELRNLTSLLSEMLGNNQGNNQGNAEEINSILDNCYKGMANVSTSNRTLITVPGFGEALCDTTTDGGGWVVFQRRTDEREDFHRNWADYKYGFGNVSTGGDYWLGLEAIHALTSQRNTELRVDMKHAGTDYDAVYSSFDVSNEVDNYRLTVGGFTGNVDEELSYHSDMAFTTYDADHDVSSVNCAEYYNGGWWYNDCVHVNLNGFYGVSGYDGIYWAGVGHPISVTEMKLRITN